MRKTVLLLFILLICSAGQLFAKDSPYVLLISLDGFRWDYAHRQLTPNLEKIAQNGVSALSLRPAFPTKTFPNHYSLITGLYPENHGILLNRFGDPFRKETYRLGDTVSVRESRWYLGEAFWETAERQGVRCASYFWPGSEQNLPYRRPTYFEHYEHKRPYETRIQGVLQWLQLPEERRPHFITLYFHETDTQGHRFGPEAAETDSAIALVDRLLGKLMQGLARIDMLDKTNLIVVSDHGMTAIDPQRRINIEKLLAGLECEILDDGPIMPIRAHGAVVDSVYSRLKRNQRHFSVYRRENVPAYWHFSKHPFIPELIVVPEPGWMLSRNASRIRGRGDHGFDNHHLDSHGIFYATGPAFKTGYRTGTLWNIDVYPLLCEIFGIMPRSNIDGRLERISFILREAAR